MLQGQRGVHGCHGSGDGKSWQHRMSQGHANLGHAAESQFAESPCPRREQVWLDGMDFVLSQCSSNSCDNHVV